MRWTPALAAFLDPGVGRGALHPLASDLTGRSIASPPLSPCFVLFSAVAGSMGNQGEPGPSRLPARHRRPDLCDIVHPRPWGDDGAGFRGGARRRFCARWPGPIGKGRSLGLPVVRREEAGWGIWPGYTAPSGVEWTAKRRSGVGFRHLTEF
jgi:hypothetical protein